MSDTLVASDYKDPPTVSEEPEYIVRRLTPTECARLQGFPDWWCDGLATEKPSDEELYFWYKVFETWRRVTNPGTKPKSSNQIRKWLADPHSDSAEYRMWSNGVALPCVAFPLHAGSLQGLPGMGGQRQPRQLGAGAGRLPLGAGGQRFHCHPPRGGNRELHDNRQKYGADGEPSRPCR